MNSATRTPEYRKIYEGMSRDELEQKYLELYEKKHIVADMLGIGDDSSFAKSREAVAAIHLGHELADTLSGADAIDNNGEEIEYKSTIGKNCVGAYTGISVQSSWPEQERYLREKKIAKYTRHYYNRFENGKMVESWVMDGKKVYDILLKKLKKTFERREKEAKEGKDPPKDPRLSATVSWTQIKEFGTKII